LLKGAKYDKKYGGTYYWDSDENIWWTWETPNVILKKFPQIVAKKRLGGVFVWGLGEDAPKFTHLKALTTEVRAWSNAMKTDRQFRNDL